MNGGVEINKNDLLDILERISSTKFNRLVFTLNVPKNLMPSEDKEQTQRAIALLEWAVAPGGCGLEKIKQALERMEIDLGGLLCPPKDPNQIHNIVEDKLFNFDHRATLKTFTEVVDQLEVQKSAGIFILQECWSQGGKYCHRRLINHLRNSTAEGKFHTFNINYIDGELSLKGLLYRLAHQLKKNQNLAELNEKEIIDILVKEISVLIPEEDSGHIYLFHIKDYDSLLKDTSFWDCFFEQFWSRFIQKFPSLATRHHSLKLIFLFETQICIELSPSYIDRVSQVYTQTKIVKLPLEPCDIEEINQWLYNFSCLPQPKIRTIVDLLKSLKSTDRKPDRVYDYLKNQMIQHHLQNV
jgi:hypothetical protein